MTEGAMEMTYTLTGEDYFQFNKFVAKRKWSYYTNHPAVSGIVAAATCTLVVRVFSDRAPSWIILLGALTAGGLGVGAQFFLMRRCLRRVPANAHRIGTLTVRVDPEGVRVKTAISEGTVRWEGVLQIAETLDYVYLLTGQYVGFVVPKRAFTDLATGKAFVDTARSYCESSRRPIASDC